MNGSEQLLKRLPNDIGGLDAGPVERAITNWSPGRSAATRWPTFSTFTRSSTRRRSAAESRRSEPR
jgi:hypothetical protein